MVGRRATSPSPLCDGSACGSVQSAVCCWDARSLMRETPHAKDNHLTVSWGKRTKTNTCGSRSVTESISLSRAGGKGEKRGPAEVSATAYRCLQSSPLGQATGEYHWLKTNKQTQNKQTNKKTLSTCSPQSKHTKTGIKTVVTVTGSIWEQDRSWAIAS